MSDIGCPIVGDKKYNSKTNPIRRMGLHANKLVINHPITGKEMVFECDIPNSFIKRRLNIEDQDVSGQYMREELMVKYHNEVRNDVNDFINYLRIEKSILFLSNK